MKTTPKKTHNIRSVGDYTSPPPLGTVPDEQDYTVSEEQKEQDYTVPDEKDYTVWEEQDYTVSKEQDYTVPDEKDYTVWEEQDYTVSKEQDYTV
ncbi:hypothetical protein CHS0354_018270 [Potamilus streckersoni]|uniref:Uncharacterized protein n=1 Tax=Potamilus streckersoni TaxID=2493646 RepID=A0AAE0SJF7_9BIVA|nr:hypothetical protein CHS0354_018270 [Potamilus streckersoni]